MLPRPLPTPPWDMPPFDTGNAIMMAMNGPLVLCGLIWAIRVARRRGSLIPLGLLFGGAIASIHECLLDVIAHCFVPYSPAWTAFSLYGRPITWWHPAAYAVFYGLMPALLYERIRSGIGAGAIWATMAAVVAFDLVMEGVMIQFGTWAFYGKQPLTLAGMPLWWGAMNCIGMLTTATVVALIAPHLKGPRALVLVAWVPVQHAAEIAAVGWPSWTVINSDVPAAVRELGGLASYAIFAVLVAACIGGLRRAALLGAAPVSLRPSATAGA